MSIKTLKEIIEKQKKEKEDEHNFDPAEQIKEYKTLVEQLYSISLESIDELIKGGLIKQSREVKSIYEELLGSYEIESLILSINNNKVRFDPVGTMLIGSKGRVDIIGPFGKEKFLLIRKGVKSPRDLISIKFKVGEEVTPEENIDDDSDKKTTIHDWEWKTMPSDSRWTHFEDVNYDTITNIIMRMING